MQNLQKIIMSQLILKSVQEIKFWGDLCPHFTTFYLKKYHFTTSILSIENVKFFIYISFYLKL